MQVSSSDREVSRRSEMYESLIYMYILKDRIAIKVLLLGFLISIYLCFLL